MKDIKVKDLHKSYGKVHASRSVSFEVEKGILGLLGPNEAGKTTLIKFLLWLLKLDGGEARLFGYDCYTQFLEKIKSLGYLSKDHNFTNIWG